MAEELHYRARKAAMNLRRLNYLNVGEVLRRRGYRCKACDGEVPLVSFWNTGDAVCTERLCLARLSGSWAGCTYCRAMVCPQCILGSDMLASAKEFELAMTAAPAVGAEVVPHFWRHDAQAALADQAEPAPPAVAGTTTTWAALRGKEFELAMTAAPDAFFTFQGGESVMSRLRLLLGRSARALGLRLRRLGKAEVVATVEAGPIRI